MNKSIIYLLVMWAGFILPSCLSVNSLSIEVRNPARVQLPSSVNRVLVMNNAANQSADFQNTVYYLGQKREDATINADSICIYACLGLSNALNNSELAPEALFYGTIFGAKSQDEVSVLSQEKVSELCSETETDALVILDRMLIASTLEIKGGRDAMYGSFTTLPVTRFSVYIPGKEHPWKVFDYTDTVRWDTEKYLYNRNEVLSMLPIGRDAIHETAYFEGVELAEKIAPFWTQENRYIYSNGNANMKQASSFVRRNNWEDAVRLWEDVYNKTNTGISRAYAATNLAVAAELKDDYESAIRWQEHAVAIAGKSSKKSLLRGFQHYLERLKKREQVSAPVL